LAAAAVPLLAAVAVYLPALRNGFVWDDPTVLVQLRALHSAYDLVVLPPIIPHFYYRPFIFLTYLVDRSLGGETPFWFHASVIAWHVLNTGLVFMLARRLFARDWLIASGGALLFAVLPTHVESVAWMAGRSDVIVCTFVLLTVLLFMERDRIWSAWLGGAACLLALLSKEMAVALVLLIPLLDVIATRRLYPVRYLPLFGALVVYFWLRSRTLGTFVGGMPSSLPLIELAPALVRALGFYVLRALVPAGLCPYIPDVPQGTGYLLAGCLAPLAAAGAVVLALRRRAWQPAFLLAWFFVTLGPSLTVIVRRSASAVVADRYLYVPSVASSLLLAWLLVRIAQERRLRPAWSAAVMVAVSGFYAMLTLPYIPVWADNFAFWNAIAAQVPDDAMPHRELATALVERGRLADAERALQQALVARSSPEGRLMTYNNLGNLYRRTGRYDDAERAFAAAIAIGPHPALQHNLGMTLMAKIEHEQSQGDRAGVLRDIVKARDAFEEALRLGRTPGATQVFIEWEPAKTHALLGQVLFSLGDRDGARQHLETALQLAPNGSVADVTRRYLEQMKP